MGHVVRWNGTRWSLQAIPKPAGASQIDLNDVSCPSATACTAVGWGSAWAAIERWNGRSWSIQLTPERADRAYPYALLTNVSCAVPTDCTAVGYRYGANGAFNHGPLLAEHWNGTKWSLETIRDPADAATPTPTGLSCSSNTACSLVGNYHYMSGYFVERWNGRRWSIQATVAATDTSLSLSGVLCTALTGCTAVGSYTSTSGTQVTLVMRWNGISRQTSGPPTGVPGAQAIPSRFRFGRRMKVKGLGTTFRRSCLSGSGRRGP